MRIIIDECVPSIVKRGLPERGIVSVQDMGWSGIKNGRLLGLVADEFDVFITSDKNLRFQQNLAVIELAVVVLPSNQVPVVAAMLTEIDEALDQVSGPALIEL